MSGAPLGTRRQPPASLSCHGISGRKNDGTEFVRRNWVGILTVSSDSRKLFDRCSLLSSILKNMSDRDAIMVRLLLLTFSILLRAPLFLSFILLLSKDAEKVSQCPDFRGNFEVSTPCMTTPKVLLMLAFSTKLVCGSIAQRHRCCLLVE
jgi:hypothetical protein